MKISNMTELQQSLAKCRVDGNILYLPSMGEGPLKNYKEVRTALLNAGAAYKRNTFVFPNQAQPYIDKLMNGAKVNIKKDFQFFETPPSLADRMVLYSGIKEGDCVLEPSAGQGAIINAIYKAFPHYMHGPNDKPSVTVDYCELMDINRDIISKKISADKRWSSSTSFMGIDFLQFYPDRLYDVIIANPPFTKNADIDHIYKMYECVKPGGRIVTVASPSWTFGSQKKQVKFRQWLKDLGAEIQQLDEGTFKDSGTSIKAMLLIIDK